MEQVTARTREPSRAASSPGRSPWLAREWGLFALVLVALGLLVLVDWHGDRGLVRLVDGAAATIVLVAVALLLNQCRRQRAAAVSAERQAGSARVAEAQRDLMLAIEGTGIGLFYWDGEAGLFRVSDTFRSIFGLAPTDPVSERALLSRTYPADRERVAEALRRCRSGGARVEFEHRILRRDGTLRWAQVIVAPMPRPAGGPERLHGTVRDITDLKALEAEGEQGRAKLAELVEQQVAIQTISAFAHDLNQPLLAIAAYSEAALNTLRRGVTDMARLQRMIEGSHNQALRAGALMHDMSAQLARAHETRVDNEPFSINDVVGHAAKQVFSRRFGAPLPVLELAPALPWVAGSRVRTNRILENLLVNAYQASQNPGKAGLAGRVVVSTRRVEGHAEVSVKDFGPGVPPAEAERIFSPFFSTKQSSLGLGLSISRALAESQGGRLELGVCPEPGAEFLLTLPLASSHAQDLSH